MESSAPQVGRERRGENFAAGVYTCEGGATFSLQWEKEMCAKKWGVLRYSVDKYIKPYFIICIFI